MKLGVSYNIFEDAIEHLEGSLRCIRDHVDYINLIIQLTSNFGEKMKMPAEDFMRFVDGLKQKGLVDFVYDATPYIQIKAPAYLNETIKRNIGMLICKRKEGCTHFMTIDCDEYYNPKQFVAAKAKAEGILEGSTRVTFCQMQTYYKEPIYRYKTPETYYVSFIYDLRHSEQFVYAHENAAYKQFTCDSSRHMVYDDCECDAYAFPRQEIEMHHLSHIRKDYRYKLELGSSIYLYRDGIDRLVDFHERWKYPEKATAAGIWPEYVEIEKVDKLPWLDGTVRVVDG